MCAVAILFLCIDFYSRQSIGSSPILMRASLTLENGLLPKKPRYALSGLGWTDWIDSLNTGARVCASLPQRIATASWSAAASAMLLVITCHPRTLCALERPTSVVRIRLRSSTPSSLHFSRLPDCGISKPRSECSSLKIFCRDAGIFLTSPGIENARPCAFPAVG